MFITALFIITKKLETIQMSFNWKRDKQWTTTQNPKGAGTATGINHKCCVECKKPDEKRTQQEGNHVWYWKPS